MFKKLIFVIISIVVLLLNIYCINVRECTLLDSNSTEDLFENLSSKFVNLFEKIVMILKGAILNISRIAYSLFAMVGVLIYFSRLNKRLGLDLIKGALTLL